MEKERVPFRLSPALKSKLVLKVEKIGNGMSINKYVENLVVNDLNNEISLSDVIVEIREVKELLVEVSKSFGLNSKN